jgi:uncharacterized protein YaaW (UPF0174 family)
VANVDLSAGVPLAVLSAQIGASIAGFLAYRIAVIVANATAKQVLGRGLTFAANTALTRGLAVFIGPIGWIVSGLWAGYDLAGPAFRITLPCCCHIAYLRQAKKYRSLAIAEEKLS